MKNLQYLIGYVLSVIAFIEPIGAADYSTDYANGISWVHTGSAFGRRESTDWGTRWKYYPAISTSTKGSIILPSELGGNTMTMIFPEAFRGCTSITNVSIPNTIVKIGNHAFYQSGNIKTIVVPDSVRTIEEYAFSQCTNLTALILPACLDNIADGMFHTCKYLQDIELPSTVTNIGDNAFGYSGVCGISIQDCVRTIGQYAFYRCSNLNELRIPKSVKTIGELAFQGCSKLKSVEFEGNAPKRNGNWPLFESHSVNSNCCSYVRRSSSGWNVEIPGFWQNARIDYAKYNITFVANGADGEMSRQSVFIGEKTKLSACQFFWKDYVFAGWSIDAKGPIMFENEESVLDLVELNENVTLYAQWAVASPVIVSAENIMYYNVSQTVSLSCATEGATILYTTDGSDPKVNGREYTKPFAIYKSCTVRAIAVKYDWKDSPEATATFTRGESLSEAANLYGYTMETDSTAPWTVDAAVSHDGVSSVRSGAIGNNGTTYLMASVKKAGTVSFWWKAQCEEPDEEDGEDGYYDYGAFLVDDVVKARIAGNDTGWRFVSVEVPTGGKHVLRWEYRKDGATSYAPDCVWVDQVQWSPADGSGYTLTSPEPVPYSWLRQYNLGVASGDFEAAANAASGKTQGGAATSVWEEFVAGTDPTNALSIFTAKIEMRDGAPLVTWEPDLNESGTKSERLYKVYGSESLDGGGEWQYPTNSLHRFFKVTVEMP